MNVTFPFLQSVGCGVETETRLVAKLDVENVLFITDIDNIVCACNTDSKPTVICLLAISRTLRLGIGLALCIAVRTPSLFIRG